MSLVQKKTTITLKQKQVCATLRQQVHTGIAMVYTRIQSHIHVTYICMDDTVDRPINLVQQTHQETTEQSIWIRQWLHHVAVGCHCDLA